LLACPVPSPISKEKPEMADDTVTRNLKSMDELDFTGWNGADWDGVFARHHTEAPDFLRTVAPK
jgi:hypothetical protein